MSELNQVTVVAATGAAYTISGAGAVDPWYDLTLNANTVFSLTAQATNPLSAQTITAIIRQDSTGGRTPSFPAGIRWGGGFVPIISQTPGAIDILQFITTDGSFWIGAISLQGAVPNSVTITSVGAGAVGGSHGVAGTYTGTRPANLDYSIDGAAFTTLGAGVATITNGTFSFALPAPAGGNHNLRVRSTSTGAVSADAAFTTGSVAVPTNVSATPTAGNGSVSVALAGTANGSAITSFTVQRSTSSTAGFADVGTQNTTNPPANGNTTATFNDTGLTNGTTYYYRAIANSAAGASNVSAVSTGVSPSAGSVAAPAHYALVDGSTRSNTASASTPAFTGGYIDMVVWCAPSDLTVENNLTGKWNSGAQSDSIVLFTLKEDGTLFIAWCSSSGIKTRVSAQAIPAFAADTGIWLRCQMNVSAAAITPVAGSPVSPVPAITAIYSYAMPTTLDPTALTWIKLGANVALEQTGLATPSIPAFVGSRSAGSVFKGRIFRAIVRDHTGAINFNPDYTAQATGTTSFADTAATPNTWATTAGAIK